jgi:hypothetical protein
MANLSVKSKAARLSQNSYLNFVEIGKFAALLNMAAS